MDAGNLAILLIFGLPIIAVVTSHQRKLMEMKLKLGAQTQATPSREMQDLKRAIDELRDTTTRYDISFDAALQRIESRVGHLEGRVNAIEKADTQQITR